MPMPANGHAAPISASPVISSVNSGKSMDFEGVASASCFPHLPKVKLHSCGKWKLCSPKSGAIKGRKISPTALYARLCDCAVVWLCGCGG